MKWKNTNLTCCALRLFSSCSSRVRSRSSSASLFSHAAWSWASALWSRSTFSTYALFLCSSSSSCRLRACTETRPCSSSSFLRWHSSPETRRCWICLSRRSRSRCCSSSKTQTRKNTCQWHDPGVVGVRGPRSKEAKHGYTALYISSHSGNCTFNGMWPNKGNFYMLLIRHVVQRQIISYFVL